MWYNIQMHNERAKERQTAGRVEEQWRVGRGARQQERVTVEAAPEKLLQEGLEPSTCGS